MAGCIRHIELDPTCPVCRPDYEQGATDDPHEGAPTSSELRQLAREADPVQTADMFALEVERDTLEGERALESQVLREQTSRHYASVWSVAIALCFLGFFATIATIVYCITTEHDHEHAKQVTVWCYADPNSNDATSQATGSAADMRDFCPNYPRG